MVEFAFVLIPLLILILGIINIGYLLAQQVEVHNAARQGGRAAVVVNSPGATPEAKAQIAVDDVVTNGTVGTADADIINGTCGGGDTTTGQPLTVQVTAPDIEWLTPIPFVSEHFGLPDALTATAVYQCEW